ncbi:MAG: MurR/RpiR family transcriptional regulator [Rhodospirillaceae bacterium]
MGRSPASRKPDATAQEVRNLKGFLTRLTVLQPKLGPTAQRIAAYVLANTHDVIHMSVTELAEATRASEGSVISLCQQLGATGFQQAKIALAQELVRPIQFIHEDLDRADDVGTVIAKIFHSDIQALQDTLSALDREAVAAAVGLIRAAERVEIYGIGSAAPVAEDLHYRMLRIGVNCKVVVDSVIQAISAPMTGPEVAVITVSHSGSTQETYTATKLAKEAGAKTICITNFGKSPIQAFADVLLFTLARETQFRTEAMTSRIAQLAIVDVLIACLALADYDKAVDAIHRTLDGLSLKRF